MSWRNLRTSSQMAGLGITVAKEEKKRNNINYMDNRDFAFGKTNFVLIDVSTIIVLIGFTLLTGASSSREAFDSEIFSALRIKVAPVICFVGFVSIIAGIMYKPKKK